MKFPLPFVTKQGKTIVIRPLESGDLDGMYAFVREVAREDGYMQINGRTFTKAQEKAYIAASRKAMSVGQKIHLVAVSGRDVVASAEVRRLSSRKNHVGEIGVVVAGAWRGSGIGKKLMELLIGEAASLGLRLLTLESFQENADALRLYEKMGFVVAGAVPGMYQHRAGYQGCVIMYRPLVSV